MKSQEIKKENYEMKNEISSQNFELSINDLIKRDLGYD